MIEKLGWVPARLEKIILNIERTSEEERELVEWLAEDATDEQWQDYFALMEQRRRLLLKNIR